MVSHEVHLGVAVTRTQYMTIETDIHARLNRLLWSKWHIRVLIDFGTVWIVDGLEATVVGNITT